MIRAKFHPNRTRTGTGTGTGTHTGTGTSTSGRPRPQALPPATPRAGLLLPISGYRLKSVT